MTQNKNLSAFLTPWSTRESVNCDDHMDGMDRAVGQVCTAKGTFDVYYQFTISASFVSHPYTASTKFNAVHRLIRSFRKFHPISFPGWVTCLRLTHVPLAHKLFGKFMEQFMVQVHPLTERDICSGPSLWLVFYVTLLPLSWNMKTICSWRYIFL